MAASTNTQIKIPRCARSIEAASRSTQVQVYKVIFLTILLDGTISPAPEWAQFIFLPIKRQIYREVTFMALLQSLHVGVNKVDPKHYGSEAPLRGCENDARDMEELAAKLWLQNRATSNTRCDF
jgi:hypothetical protein